MLIRIHPENGSVQSFVQNDESTARETWEAIDPPRLFTQPRVIIAGAHSRSVFVGSAIVRIDFVQHFCPCWKFPKGFSDVVELSEPELRKHARLDEPEFMPKREQDTPVGDLLVSFLKLDTTLHAGFKGLIEDVRHYSRALSQAEIETAANE